MRAKKAEIKAERLRSSNDSDAMSGFDSDAAECTESISISGDGFVAQPNEAGNEIDPPRPQTPQSTSQIKIEALREKLGPTEEGIDAGECDRCLIDHTIKQDSYLSLRVSDNES